MLKDPHSTEVIEQDLHVNDISIVEFKNRLIFDNIMWIFCNKRPHIYTELLAVNNVI